MVTHPKNKTYRVAGEVRGVISYHRSLGAAIRSLLKDQRGCDSLGGGAYSDCWIQEWNDGVYVAIPCDDVECYGI